MKHIIFVFVLMLSCATKSNGLMLEFVKNVYKIHMGDVMEIEFKITDSNNLNSSQDIFLEFIISNEHVADFDGNSNANLIVTLENGVSNGSLPVTANFLGQAIIVVKTRDDNNESTQLGQMNVIVIRKVRTIDHVFTASVAILVSLIYINFGCALNWGALRPMLRRPVGPMIGFVGQFLVMPLLSYLFGLLVFSNWPEMRLGLFFVGVSPAGGASNVWTCVLDGNIDLSVTMTTISTLAAFAMMPLWLFTVGPNIFADANIAVPYTHIAGLAGALVLPLFIGWLIQRCLPVVSALLVHILKGFSSLLIAFIIAFAIATNVYLFELMSWRIVLAGLLLPWFGYALGGGLALLARQPPKDLLAIAIETGVQNTGIAIFLIRFSLPQPEADLTTVVPVAIAIMTPIPLAIFYFYNRICRKNSYAISDD